MSTATEIDGLTLADAWMLASSTHGFATATSRSDAVRLVPLSQQLWRFRESFTGRASGQGAAQEDDDGG